MIPWDTFKTPQDAYEWAKRNLLYIQGPIALIPNGWAIQFNSIIGPPASQCVETVTLP